VRRVGALVRLTAVIMAAALLLGLTAATVLGAIVHRADLRPAYAENDLLVILAIGSDIGMPYRSGDPLRGRADGLHLIAIDTAERRATIVNIPRDTLAGGTKINAHLAFGGPDRQVAVVEDLTGISIDYYALTTFRGIEELVRIMGGVEVEVERRMSDPFSGSNFQPGTHRLDGPQALAYLRDRKSLPDGDFGRTRHHGNFMRFTHDQLRRDHRDLADVVYLVSHFSRTTVTDIPFSELLPLAALALEIDPADVHQDALTGGFGTTSGGASIVHLRPGDAFERIRNGDVGPPR
jgi:polyisoprenyl-teichoic acid--peptidoglycan teichoic acid transferase